MRPRERARQPATQRKRASSQLLWPLRYLPVARRPLAPLVLRFGDADAARVAAGTWVPTAASRLQAALATSLRATRQQRAQCVWIAGFAMHRRDFPWGERAAALAQLGSAQGWWGPLALGVPSLAACAPRAPLVPWAHADSDCPVCLQPLTDMLPTADARARAPSGRWSCVHAVCRDCDLAVQRSANSRCPLCRAVRVVRVCRPSVPCARLATAVRSLRSCAAAYNARETLAHTQAPHPTGAPCQSPALAGPLAPSPLPQPCAVRFMCPPRWWFPAVSRLVSGSGC